VEDAGKGGDRMDDLISRQAAIDYCYALINAEHLDRDEMNYSQERVNQTEVILHHLEFLPAVAPVRMKGKWQKRNGRAIGYICTSCGKSDISNRFAFCPNCGADMREEKDG
jgi:rubrerythrin